MATSLTHGQATQATTPITQQSQLIRIRMIHEHCILYKLQPRDTTSKAKPRIKFAHAWPMHGPHKTLTCSLLQPCTATSPYQYTGYCRFLTRLLMSIAQMTQMALPISSGVTRYIHPKFVILLPPLMKMREAAPAGGWEMPQTCIAAMDVAGASATATHFGMTPVCVGDER